MRITLALPSLGKKKSGLTGGDGKSYPIYRNVLNLPRQNTTNKVSAEKERKLPELVRPKNGQTSFTLSC
jgi:hypothetical protein